ncbi:MAG: DoxX family membrane protein [Desulfobacteraceae bacterium]|nr:DoxX family membrane protein [Desulfobacteraceae bacterium]
MTKKKTDIIELLIRVILGLTFIIASVHKIIDPAGFAKIIYGYGIFPDVLINIIAIIVPFIELVAGLCLLTGLYFRSALILINLLLLGFICIISFNLLRGYQFDCGCFSFSGTNSASSAVSLLIRDILLLGIGMFLYAKKVRAQRFIFTTP